MVNLLFVCFSYFSLFFTSFILFSYFELIFFLPYHLLSRPQPINMATVSQYVKQAGVVRGITYLLLLNLSAHITKKLGMAPGGKMGDGISDFQVTLWARTTKNTD